MSKSIRPHPKYGVNPTIPVCVWCGKEKNEIAMLGASYKEEAPMRMVLDYEPCDSCKGKMAQGVTFIEASHTPVREGWPPFVEKDGETFYITGRWVVAKEEAIDHIITSKEMAEEVLRSRKAFVDVDAFSSLFANNERP